MAVPPHPVPDSQPCKLGLRTQGSWPSAHQKPTPFWPCWMEVGGSILLPFALLPPAPGRTGWRQLNQTHVTTCVEPWGDPAAGALGLGQLSNFQL